MLEELGIELIFPDQKDPRFAPWVGIARNLHREPEFSVLGLVPVERNTGAIAPALQLAVAIHHLSARSVTVVDCNTASPVSPPRQATASDETLAQLEREVCRGVWFVARARATRGVDVDWCSAVITERRAHGHFVICDLTGLAETGALGSYYALLDGIVSVVRSGATFEWRLSALHRQFPKPLDRGVLFVDT